LDEDLLAELGRSNPQASAAFIELFKRRVFGLAKSIVGDPDLAEDIAREAFVQARRHARSYDSRRGSVSTWLLFITRNLAIGSLGKVRAQPMDPERLTIASGHETSATRPEGSATLAGDRAKVHGALRQLPLNQRRAVVLAVFFGRTGSEIGLSEGIPLGTVRTRTRLGMLKLREILTDDEPMPSSETTAINPRAGQERGPLGSPAISMS
jgi:RNA polymerase sigma-70 factor (ECF subfamily)